MPRRSTPPAVLAALLLAAAAAQADDDGPAVTPYRPSVSTPAALSEPGWLELEAGALRATGPDSGSARTTLPYTLKLAFSDQWGIRVGGDAWVRQADAGARETGGGDTSVVLKYRFGPKSPWGVELGEKFPTAGATLGSGRADTTVNGIYSADFGDWHTDLNLAETRVGLPAVQGHGWQAGWAASLSHPLAGSWGIGGEFSGTHQAAVPDTAQFLAALSWNASPRAAFDFGVARGLTDASPRNQVFAGVTLLLGKLF